MFSSQKRRAGACVADSVHAHACSGSGWGAGTTGGAAVSGATPMDEDEDGVEGGGRGSDSAGGSRDGLTAQAGGGDRHRRRYGAGDERAERGAVDAVRGRGGGREEEGHDTRAEATKAARRAGTRGAAGDEQEWVGGEGGAALCAAVGSLALGDRRRGADDATTTYPSSIDLTTATERAPTRGRPKVTGSWGTRGQKLANASPQ